MSGFEQFSHARPGMMPNEAVPEPLGVPFGKIAGVIRRRAGVILAMVALGTGLTALIVQRLTPRYTAEASILIEPRRTQVSDLQAISSQPENAPNILRTQVDILRSPDLLDAVVTSLDLTKVREFAPWEEGPGLISAGIDAVRDVLGLPREPREELSEATRVRTAASILARRISFGNEARSNVLRLAVETESGELSARIANEIARQFLEFKRRQKFSATQRAHEWFQERLRELAVKLREAEQTVQEFREENGLTEVLASRNGSVSHMTINAQQMVEANHQLVLIMTERARKEAQLEEMQAAIKQAGRPDAVPSVLQSPLVQRLREQEVVLAGREGELLATLGERSPDVLALRSQRRGVLRRIQEEMAHATSGLNSDVVALRLQERRLRANLSELRDRVSVENIAEVRLHGLQAEAQASRTIYESFLGRATQLANVSGIQEPDAELVSTATLPLGPSAPKKKRLLVVAAGLSLVLGLLLAFALERMRTGISSPEDMESWLGLSPIGLVPRVGMKREQPRMGRSEAAEFAAAMSRIRGNLQVLDDDRRPRVVMVTSALPKEGKSVFAAGMAESAARAGWRVLLIDCDMRRPAVARIFGIEATSGLDRVLDESSALGEMGSLLHRMPSGLVVMPTGVSKRNPQDLLSKNRMAQLLKWASEEFDLVVLDTPPVLPVADPLVLARRADAVMLAVRWDHTPQAAVRGALKLLQGSGVRMLGSVLTQVHMRRMASRSNGRAQAFRDYRAYYHSAG